MKSNNRLTIILALLLTSTIAHAQFNTIGDVKHRPLKPKSPQETTVAAPMDSIMMSDSLPLESVPAPSTSMNILPYLSASLPLKSIRISFKFGMRVHPVMHKYCLHNGIDLQAHYEKGVLHVPQRGGCRWSGQPLG